MNYNSTHDILPSLSVRTQKLMYRSAFAVEGALQMWHDAAVWNQIRSVVAFQPKRGWAHDEMVNGLRDLP